jgi:hypothetical protein
LGQGGGGGGWNVWAVLILITAAAPCLCSQGSWSQAGGALLRLLPVEHLALTLVPRPPPLTGPVGGPGASIHVGQGLLDEDAGEVLLQGRGGSALQP